MTTEPIGSTYGPVVVDIIEKYQAANPSVSDEAAEEMALTLAHYAAVDYPNDENAAMEGITLKQDDKIVFYTKNQLAKMILAGESEPVEIITDDDDEVYEPLLISPGDRITVKLTHAFVVNGQTQWSTAETEIAVLPNETSEEASERAQAIALGTVFQAADNLVSIIDQRREAQKALLNKTQA